MPYIDDIVQTAKKPFKKKAYRPWDLFDELPPAKKIRNEAVDKKAPEISQQTIEKTHKDYFNVKNSSDKKLSIGKQLVTKLDNNMETNRYQKDNKKGTIITSKKTISKQLDSRLVNALVNNFEKPVAKKRSLSEEIYRLTGHQKKILFFMVEACASKGLLTTGQITNETLRTLLNTDQNTVKTSVHRLIVKGLIKREEGKRGNGGFTCYTISEAIRNIIIQEKQKRMFSNQLDNALVNNKVSDKITSSSSSSSIIDLNTTTTEELINAENFDWLKDIDIKPLSAIGFSIYHLKQITSQNKLSSDIIQQSINAFAFDLTENNKAQTLKREPLNFFMGILRKGMPYVPPPNYESPEDRAMRIFLERKKEAEKKRLEMEEEALKIAFEEWFNLLSEAEREALIPSHEKNFIGSAHRMAWFRTYFKQNIWGLKKAEFLSTV